MKLTLVLGVCFLFAANIIADDSKDELVKKYADLIASEQKKAEEYKIRTSSINFKPANNAAIGKSYYFLKNFSVTNLVI